MKLFGYIRQFYILLVILHIEAFKINALSVMNPMQYAINKIIRQ